MKGALIGDPAIGTPKAHAGSGIGDEKLPAWKGSKYGVHKGA